jgi:hypothetical protein
MSEQTLRLAEDADLDHENARDWYDSYGWHLTTENEGDLTLDVVEYHWLNEPDQEVVNHIRETYYDLTDEEVMSLIEKAREVRANAEAVEALLGEAVEAYGRGDVAAVIRALDEAERIESGHGDCPASRSLRGQLFAEIKLP